MDTENMLPHSMNGLTGMNGLSGTIPPSTLNTPNGQQQAKPAEPVPSSMSDQVTDADFPEMNEDELKFAVIHELKVRIQAWVDDPSGNSRNLSAFARKAQVTDSTIRRIMSPGGGSIPNQDNLMRILVALTGLKSSREVLEYFEKRKSPVSQYLKRHTYFWSTPLNQSLSFVMEGVSSPTIPNDDDVYFAYGMIDARGRMSFLELLKMMGESAHIAVDRLVRNGLILLSEDGVLRLAADAPIYTRETALNVARVLINRFTRSYAEQSKITLFIESVNDEGILALRSLSNEYCKAVAKVVDNHKGSNPVFLYEIIDTMEFKMNGPESRGNNA